MNRESSNNKRDRSRSPVRSNEDTRNLPLRSSHSSSLQYRRNRKKNNTNECIKVSLDYEFGDLGSNWRMMKLNRIFEAAKESEKSLIDIVKERYGTEIEFEIAKQEQKELEDRKCKPKKDWIFQPNVEIERFVKEKNGNITTNDISIQDLIQQEKNEQFSFDEQSAKSILKDSQFESNLEYQDENASKLASYVQSGKVNLSDIQQNKSNPQSLQRIMKNLDRCELCLENNSLESIPISMGQKTYLTLLPYNSYNKLFPSNTTAICLNEHRENTLYCEDDEWDEIENFMKTLATYYYKEYKKGVIFIENAVDTKYQRNHAHILVIPISLSICSQAEGYFKEAIISQSDDLEDQHKSVLDTQLKGRERSQGTRRQAGMKQLLAKEAPYFHVWFSLDGGIGHIVENYKEWPKYDLFTRQVVGEGLLKCQDPMLVNSTKDYKKWKSSARSGEEMERVERFRRKWKAYDWTEVNSE